ncbi:50S ribosomal protein L31 [Candidatus Azambacteria bacterium RIFCSPHIGHO2_02_FULL_52_12]|uniref:Large ribosomal subunit protein bL31 n=1 Tax=Candidatus Azambacteria bacterium RIFCSPLOWO2_01_FULL_46_25 TaxID=1797298 RepID=A0A1F5BTD2_9BACT|nr:MAG: 50S ribosomal protein L31 [Candidatus Azambacteria bacterium RIFCSPHIGHO2_02_FULL_52_12]OGD33883.1 MAG: 50S ribosomal protein L31 [Candidatus Azambacteria bacterium RIFCSPLOWO2_01_FULL_46_25]OGD36790.1 MAG: 50S ribosomal protein L31 [Candidatus Azambacteria bacterium RIFCSPHIGHO2_01_FULL_51_74]
MKKDIHPAYYNATVSCACGNTFQTGSIMKELKIEICNACHPFYTGKEKTLDAAGRVEKFKRKVASATALKKKSK